MDPEEPWAERLRPRGDGSKRAETSTTVKQGSIAERKSTTRKKDAAKSTGKEAQSATPSRKKAISWKRKTNNLDNDSVNPDHERESKRTCSPHPLPPTPTSETRQTGRSRNAQTQTDKPNLTISPPSIVESQVSLPTPSRTGGYVDRMTESTTALTDLSNGVSPIGAEKSPTLQAATTEVNNSVLVSPPASDQGNLQLPSTLSINVVESSRVERPYHSAPATTSSFQESSRRDTIEQSQAERTLEPAIEFISARISRDNQSPTTEELPQVGRLLDYRNPDYVVETHGIERLLTLANLAENTPAASQTNEDPLDLHEIVSGLFLGSYIFILRKLISGVLFLRHRILKDFEALVFRESSQFVHIPNQVGMKMKKRMKLSIMTKILSEGELRSRIIH